VASTDTQVRAFCLRDSNAALLGIQEAPSTEQVGHKSFEINRLCQSQMAESGETTKRATALWPWPLQ
jgi:hypothetical protein